MAGSWDVELASEKRQATRAGVMSLYSADGTPLSRDAIALELKKAGLEFASGRDVQRKVDDRVKEIVHDKRVEEWEEKRRVTWRNYHYGMAGLCAIAALQIVLFIVGIWMADWRPAQTAFVLFMADLGMLGLLAYLEGRIPDKDSKPTMSRY